MVFSPRASARLSTGGRPSDRSSQGSVSGALADHVPNIQLGGPKGRQSTGGGPTNTNQSPPDGSMPPTAITPNRSPAASAAARHPTHQPSQPAWMGATSPRPSSHVSARNSDSARSSTSASAAASALASSRTSSAAGQAPNPTKTPHSPRSVSATAGAPRTPRPGPAATATKAAASPPCTTTFTTGRSTRGGTPSSARGTSPLKAAKRSLPLAKEEAISSGGACRSVRHPHSLRTDPQRRALPMEKAKGEAPTRISKSSPPITFVAEKENVLSSLMRRGDRLAQRAPSRSTSSSAATAAAAPTDGEASSEGRMTTTISASNAGASAAEAAPSPRPSSAGAATVSAVKSARQATSQTKGQRAKELASEFFRFHYYYYPDKGNLAGKDEEEEAATRASASQHSLPSSPQESNETSLSNADDVVELNDTLRTPPALGLPLALAGEAPFTPRGAQVSPFFQRLAEMTTASAHHRRSGGAVSGGSGSHSRLSPPQRVTQGGSSDSHASRRQLSQHSPRTSSLAPPRCRPMLDEEPDAEEDEEEAAVLRAQLKMKISSAQARLAAVTQTLQRYTDVVNYRLNEKALVEGELSEVQQQAESLKARAADVVNTARELETKHHANEELDVLRDMLAERTQRLETMEAKRDALTALWEQLQFLHEEAQQQEAERRKARRQQRHPANSPGSNQEAAEEEEAREGSVPLTESEHDIKRSMLTISRANAAVAAASVPHEDTPLGQQPPRRVGFEEHEDACTNVSDSSQEEEWEEESEPEVSAPSGPQPSRRAVLPSVSMSPSMSRARGPSVISAGTVDILQGFLGELFAEMDALAMICIQKPSPPAASQCSRVNRAAGASAWLRDINTGNNGFFSFFGGATEAHLSAKPLSTFLSCASRLARSAWRMEAEVQLRARELATEEEEDELRRRLAGRPAYEPAPVVELLLEDEGSDNDVTRRDESNVKTPTRQEKSGARRATVASPELSRSAGKRRRVRGGEADGVAGSSPHPHSPSSPEMKASFGATATAAPQVFLPSLAYAAPRLPVLSRQLDGEQLALQKAYEEDIEQQRTRRRCLVKRLKETYRHHVEPQLTGQLRVQRERQETLARELVALGVAEVCMQWEELGDEDDDEEKDHRGADESRAAWGRRAGRRDEGKGRRSGSTATGRSTFGGANPTCFSPAKQPAPAKYLRQVVVRALQVTETPASANNHTTVTHHTRQKSVSASVDNATADSFGPPMVSSTRQRLLPSPTPAPHHSARGRGAVATTPAAGRSIAGDMASPGGTGRLPLTPRPVATAASTALKTVMPMTPSPLKGRPPPSARSARSSASADGAPRSACGTPSTRDSSASLSVTFTEETRERLDAAGRPVRGSPTPTATATTPHRGQAAALGESRRRATLTPPYVNLLGTNPADAPEMMGGGAVKVSLLFFGEEARRRQREEAEKDRHLREFWALREELARADETNFILAHRVEEMEEDYKALRGRHARSVQEAMEKLSKVKRYHATIRAEKGEWEDMRAELEAARDALERERERSAHGNDRQRSRRR